MIGNTMLALHQRRGAVCILHSNPYLSPSISPTAARQLGFSYVFNTNLSRHLKEIAESRELKKRLKRSVGNKTPALSSPLISCECPLCAETILREYPTLTSLFTPYKPTIAVQSAIVRDIWTEHHRVGPADVFQVAVIRSGHKAERSRLCALAGVDDAITPEELASQLSQAEISTKPGSPRDRAFDAPFNTTSLSCLHKGNRHKCCHRTVYLNTEEDVSRVLDSLARKKEGSERQYAGTIIRLNHCGAFREPETDTPRKRRRRKMKKWLLQFPSSSHILSNEQTEILQAVRERGKQILVLEVTQPQNSKQLMNTNHNHLQEASRSSSHKTAKQISHTSKMESSSKTNSPTGAGTKAAANGGEFLVLYGSQSGSTERQAELFTAKARGRGFKVRLFPCERISSEELKKLIASASSAPSSSPAANPTTLVIITSTVGDGELPENAKSFREKLWALEGDKPLRGLRYAVCGFGNSAFGDNFCIAARRLRAQLQGLGARELAGFAACDVSNTSKAEARFSSFTEEVLGVNTSSAAATPTEGASGDLVKIAKGGAGWKKPPPPRGFARIPIIGSVDITPAGHLHPVREFTLSLAGAQGLARYHCGDHVQILPRNDSGRVTKLLARLKVDGNTVLNVSRAGGFIPPRVTARELFEQYLDVFTPCPRSVADAALRRVRGASAVDVARRLSAKHSLGEALLHCPGVGVRLEALAAVAPRIQPRAYSVASAPPLPTATASKSVTLSVALVRRKVVAPSGKRVVVPGLATGYLWSLNAKAHPLVAARVVRGPGLVADVANGTVVMCGLGSGIAPFLGLMQERARLLRLGKLRGRAVLCYGARSREDFAYGPLVTEYLKGGVLSAAFCAIGNEGSFVQDKIAENSALFAAALHEPGTRVYYCGPMKSAVNGEIIPNSVLRAFVKCLGSSPAKNEIIERMKHEHRIVVEAH